MLTNIVLFMTNYECPMLFGDATTEEKSWFPLFVFSNWGLDNSDLVIAVFLKWSETIFMFALGYVVKFIWPSFLFQWGIKEFDRFLYRLWLYKAFWASASISLWFSLKVIAGSTLGFDIKILFLSLILMARLLTPTGEKAPELDSRKPLL